MTYNTFYEHICDLPNSFQNRNLEAYLRTLLKLVEQEKEQDLTVDLLLKLIKEAFVSEPGMFNPEWLRITNAPDENIMSKKITNPEIKSAVDKTIISDKSGIEYTIAVLQFQIAELHKMKDKQLDDEMRYFGVYSETGNRWYNFDPMTNLECGARGLSDSEDDEESDFDVSWQTIGELLEMGRIYE